MELAEFLKILEESTQRVSAAFKQLRPFDKASLGNLLKSAAWSLLRPGNINRDQLFSDIYSEVKRMEESILEGLKNKEFEEELLNHPTAMTRINAYYDMVDTLSSSIPDTVMLSLPPASSSTADKSTKENEVSLTYSIESSTSRARAAKDGLLLSNAELRVDSLATKYNNWSISLKNFSGTTSGLLTPRSFYYLIFLCHAKRQNMKFVMTRGYPIDSSCVENMPDRIAEHLMSSDYAWKGDSLEKSFDVHVADQQSKLKHEINKQVSCEIVVFDDAHYTIHPGLKNAQIKIPALNIK